jgi:hypothetical protein
MLRFVRLEILASCCTKLLTSYVDPMLITGNPYCNFNIFTPLRLVYNLRSSVIFSYLVLWRGIWTLTLGVSILTRNAPQILNTQETASHSSSHR